MFTKMLAALALTTLILVTPGTAVAAAADTTGPTFTLQSSAHILYPSTVMGQSRSSGTPFSQDLYEVPAIQKWSASDPSGICDYQLYQDNYRGDPVLVYEGRATSYKFTMGDVDGNNGGYNWNAWALRVEDCAGNWSSSDSYFFPNDRYVPQAGVRNSTVTHDDNEATYSGAWSTSVCSCFMKGTDVHASSPGASATFTYTGNVVGWVTETGPGRGSAKIYQDGILKATVSTYSASNTGARVMWANWFATSARHTIRVVVAGTAGHPRVDVDGFLVAPDPSAG